MERGKDYAANDQWKEQMWEFKKTELSILTKNVDLPVLLVTDGWKQTSSRYAKKGTELDVLKTKNGWELTIDGKTKLDSPLAPFEVLVMVKLNQENKSMSRPWDFKYEDSARQLLRSNFVKVASPAARKEYDELLKKFPSQVKFLSQEGKQHLPTLDKTLVGSQESKPRFSRTPLEEFLLKNISLPKLATKFGYVVKMVAPEESIPKDQISQIRQRADILSVAQAYGKVTAGGNEMYTVISGEKSAFIDYGKGEIKINGSSTNDRGQSYNAIDLAIHLSAKKFNEVIKQLGNQLNLPINTVAKNFDEQRWVKDDNKYIFERDKVSDEWSFRTSKTSDKYDTIAFILFEENTSRADKDKLTRKSAAKVLEKYAEELLDDVKLKEMLVLVNAETKAPTTALQKAESEELEFSRMAAVGFKSEAVLAQQEGGVSV